MKILDLAILFVLCVLLGTGIYFFWSNLSFGPLKTKEYSNFVGNISEGTIFESSQFYPNMRFAKREISYNIEPACDEKKKTEIEESLAIIDEKTVITFYPKNDNAEIEIICSDKLPEEEVTDSRFFVAGEGGPTEARNLSTGYLILKGKVSLFKDERCESPKLALHELLHVLGFDHNNDKKSIMYPITNCDQKLDEYIIEEINRLYSIESLPDLAILKINATRSFYGISFKVSIINLGYIEAKDSQIEIFSGQGKVSNYSLDEIQPGMISTLEVKNLRVKGSDGPIKFFTSYAGNSGEISYENNVAEIYPKEEN